MTQSNSEIRQRILKNCEIFQPARRANVAQQIRGRMRDKGLKNVDVAERLGVSEANVSRWLRGNQNLHLDTLYLLADALQEPLSISVGMGRPWSSEIAEASTSQQEFVDETGGESLCEMPVKSGKVFDINHYRKVMVRGVAKPNRDFHEPTSRLVGAGT